MKQAIRSETSSKDGCRMHTIEIYQYAVGLAGITSLITACVMTAAGRTRAVDVAFTLREWFYTSVFFSTWWVIQSSGGYRNHNDAVLFRNYFMFGLIIVSLLTLIAVTVSRIRSIKRWATCLIAGEDSEICQNEWEKDYNDRPKGATE